MQLLLSEVNEENIDVDNNVRMRRDEGIRLIPGSKKYF